VKTVSRSLQHASLAALVLAGLGCAHVASTAAPAADRAQAPARVVITGSRLPQAVVAEGGLPNTISPVRVYTREQLLGTGQPGLGAALGSLDPSAR